MDEMLQLSPLPGIILPIFLKVAVTFVQRSFHSFWTFDALYGVLDFHLSCFGFLLFVGFFAHGGVQSDGSRYVVYGRCVSFLGSIPQANVLRVVEVFGERLGNGVELVFDHDVDVVR